MANGPNIFQMLLVVAVALHVGLYVITIYYYVTDGQTDGRMDTSHDCFVPSSMGRVHNYTTICVSLRLEGVRACVHACVCVCV